MIFDPADWFAFSLSLIGEQSILKSRLINCAICAQISIIIVINRVYMTVMARKTIFDTIDRDLGDMIGRPKRMSSPKFVVFSNPINGLWSCLVIYQLNTILYNIDCVCYCSSILFEKWMNLPFCETDFARTCYSNVVFIFLLLWRLSQMASK